MPGAEVLDAGSQQGRKGRAAAASSTTSTQHTRDRPTTQVLPAGLQHGWVGWQPNTRYTWPKEAASTNTDCCRHMGLCGHEQ